MKYGILLIFLTKHLCMSLVSNNIKYLRRLNGLTQEQFARRIGIKRSLLGAYEEARANPNLDNLMSIARAFNTTVDLLLKNDLRKIRETPDLSLPLDRGGSDSHGATPSPLLRDTADSGPKPLSTVLDKYYQAPEPNRVHELPKESPRRPDLIPEFGTSSREPETVRLVAQRVTPRPVTSGSGFTHQPAAYPPPAPPSFNNAFEGSQSTGSRQNNARSMPEETFSQSPIPFVRHAQFGEYLQRYQHVDFLNRLPTLQLPLLPTGHYRAFEAGEEFAFPGALLIGQFVRNWYEIIDGKMYILLVQHQGIICRRLFNQVKAKGTLLLTADQPAIPSREVSIRDVQEVWEVKAFVSQQLPEPAPPLDRLRSLVDELHFELERIKK